MTPRLIFVPGLGGGTPQHWYSLWQQKFGGVRVEQADWNAPTPEDWAAQLNETVKTETGDLVLVGHSAGVLTIVHYARLFPVPERVRGAILVAPADPEQPGVLGTLRPMAPVPMQPLPFPALVIASENDPYVSFGRAAAFAEVWEAELVTVGEAGHINAESGHGGWEDGEILLGEALHAWTPPDIVRF